MKKFSALLLVMLFLISIFPSFSTAAIVDSGTCGAEGDNLTWTLDDAGTLTIGGAGDMRDFVANIYSKDTAPWLSYGDDIRSVVVSDGVTGLGDNAFYRCGNLAEITVPDTLTRIGSTGLIDTLWYSAQLEGVVYLGNYAYGYRGEYPRDGAVTLKDGTLGIADGAFSQQYRLQKMILPDTVTFIGAGAFSSCHYLKEINLSKQLKSIGAHAFLYCSGLTEIIFPDSLESIDNYAFESCNNVPEIVLPKNLKEIGAGAFSYCQFKEIEIPDSVVSIDSYAFSSCFMLQSVKIGNSVTMIGERIFNGCGRLNELSVGKIVETATFSDINTLTRVTILPGVETVCEAAFANEKYLSEVVFPTSLKKIDTNAFLYCEKLNDVYYYGTQEEWKTVSVGEGNAAIAKYAAVHYEYHEHAAGEEKRENTVAPTCTETGSFDTVRYCTICGVELSREAVPVEPLGHDLRHTVFKAATCTENGNVDHYTCARCNLMFSDEGAENQLRDVVIPATGHSFGDWTQTKAATVTEPGEETRTCTVCGAAETRATEKLPVIAVPGDVDNDGSVTAGDARLALRGAVGLETYEPGSREFTAADVDKSGDLTAADARLILRAAVGLEELK